MVILSVMMICCEKMSSTEWYFLSVDADYGHPYFSTWGLQYFQR